VRRVIVVTDAAPAWLTNVKIVPMGDAYAHNKDGNLIRKLTQAMLDPLMTSEFAWSADDCVLMRDFDFEHIPPIYNARMKEDFSADGNIWQRRVRRTFEFFEERNFPLEHNFEAHVPQRFPVRKLLRALRGIDYEADVGYSINTLFHGILGVNGGFDQSLFKVTCESENIPKLNRTLVGYNDRAFLNGLREHLFELFPTKSKYER